MLFKQNVHLLMIFKRNHYLCSVDVFRFINKCTDLGFRLRLEPFFCLYLLCRIKTSFISSYRVTRRIGFRVVPVGARYGEMIF